MQETTEKSTTTTKEEKQRTFKRRKRDRVDGTINQIATVGIKRTNSADEMDIDSLYSSKKAKGDDEDALTSKLNAGLSE